MTDAIQIQIRPRPEAMAELRARGAWDRRDWRTIAHVTDNRIERTRNELGALAPESLYEYRAIRKNPPAHLHIPPTVAELGTLLDLTTETDSTRTTWETADVGGMRMCTDPDAMNRRPGSAALYLLRTPQTNGRAKNAHHPIRGKMSLARALETVSGFGGFDTRALLTAIEAGDVYAVSAQAYAARRAGHYSPDTAEAWMVIAQEASDNERTPNAAKGKPWTCKRCGVTDAIHAPDRDRVCGRCREDERNDYARAHAAAPTHRGQRNPRPTDPLIEFGILPDATFDGRWHPTVWIAGRAIEADNHGGTRSKREARNRARERAAREAEIESVPPPTELTEAQAMQRVEAEQEAWKQKRDAKRAPKRNANRNHHNGDEADAGATYEAWHERHPEQIDHVEDLPDVIGIFVGFALRIGYRSDKWNERGTTEDYDHDYTEPAYEVPEVWADRLDLSKAHAIVIVGGNQRITADGID